MNQIHDYLELVRAPAVLTVLGDTLAGGSAAGHGLGGRRLALPLASACLYAGGIMRIIYQHFKGRELK